MRLIDFDKIPFLEIPIAPVVKGENVHYEQGALKEWFDGTQDVDAIPIPDNATNGDVIMATGLFEIVGNLSNDMLVCVSVNGLVSNAFVSFSRAWWDAPYESGVN